MRSAAVGDKAAVSLLLAHGAKQLAARRTAPIQQLRLNSFYNILY
jgi:hypothetical protein